jgi:hypothetical protein
VFTTVLVRGGVVGVGPLISHQHTCELVILYGGVGIAALLPSTLDGLIWVASIVGSRLGDDTHGHA